MANETMTVNRLPALTWNWLKMNAARLEANAPAVGAAPSFVQTAQLARSSAAQDWAMETGMGTDVDRFLANSPAEYLTLGENEVMDAPAVITYTYQPGTPAGDRLYLEAKAGSTMQVAVILRNETAGEGLAALQIKIKAEAGAVVKLSMVQVLDNGFTCLSDIGTTCADGASFELTKLELGSGKLYAGAAADLIGKGSNFTARIGYLGQGEQRLDMKFYKDNDGIINASIKENDHIKDVVIYPPAYWPVRHSSCSAAALTCCPAVPAPRARSRRTFCCWATAWSTRPFR